MTDEEMTEKRLAELAGRAFEGSYYTYTPFLGLAELNILETAKKTCKEMAVINVYLYGGADGCERVIAAFGDEEVFGYPPEFPIRCLKIEPLMQKFADKLTHRDFLGSIMNLGVEREVLGDIVVKDNVGYVFCLEGMAAYIIGNITRIKHTSVACSVSEYVPEVRADAALINVQVSSARIDACVAKVYRISRADAVSLIKGRRVYVNGVLCESGSYAMKMEDVVSVRGRGRFEFLGIEKCNRKGNLTLNILKM